VLFHAQVVGSVSVLFRAQVLATEHTVVYIKRLCPVGYVLVVFPEKKSLADYDDQEGEAKALNMNIDGALPGVDRCEDRMS